MHAFRSLLVDAAHQLEKEALLDNLVAVYSRCDALNESRVDVIRLEHVLEFLEFGFRERPRESLAIVLSAILFTANIGSGLQECQYSKGNTVGDMLTRPSAS